MPHNGYPGIESSTLRTVRGPRRQLLSRFYLRVGIRTLCSPAGWQSSSELALWEYLLLRTKIGKHLFHTPQPISERLTAPGEHAPTRRNALCDAIPLQWPANGAQRSAGPVQSALSRPLSYRSAAKCVAGVLRAQRWRRPGYGRRKPLGAVSGVIGASVAWRRLRRAHDCVSHVPVELRAGKGAAWN